MSALPHWRISPDRKTISKHVVAKNWDAAVAMLNTLSPLANSEGHHPDYHLSGYRNVRVDLSTHSIGGLSLPDFVLAAKIDAVDATVSPKWLREKTDQMLHETNSSLNVASESDIEAVQARVSAVERYIALGNEHNIEGLLNMLASPCDMFGEDASKDGMEWYFSNYKGVAFSVTEAPRAIAPGDPYTMRVGYKRSWDSVSRESGLQQRLTVDVD
jgi:4a-hydroxytetrahydrobiopterin dehydratase